MSAKRKIVETNVSHPTLVAIMGELEGKPVRPAFQHHESTAVALGTYKVEYTNWDAEV